MKRRLFIYGISLVLAAVILALVTSLYAGRKILNAKAAVQTESLSPTVAEPEPQPAQPEQPTVAEPEPQPAEPEQPTVAEPEPQPAETEQPTVAEPEPQPAQPEQPAVAEPEPAPVVLPKDPDIQLILDSLAQQVPHQEIPLIQAAEKGKLDVVKQLLADGADIETTDVAGYTALYAAVLAGHQEVVSFLSENKANPNVVDVMGVTPLMHAAFKGDTEMVRILLNAGADKAARDKMNNSVILYAKESNVPEVEELLKD